MNEKLITDMLAAFNGGIVKVPDGTNACGYVNYYRPREGMQAAIAAHSAFILEAAGREDVLRAGDLAFWAADAPEQDNECLGLKAAFPAMLDQIERTPDAT